MIFADQGALFGQFQAVLEATTHADAETMEYFQMFHTVLTKLLTGVGVSASSSSSDVTEQQYSFNLHASFQSDSSSSAGPHRVEFSDDGAVSPSERANFTHDGVSSRSYSEDYTTSAEGTPTHAFHHVDLLPCDFADPKIPGDYSDSAEHACVTEDAAPMACDDGMLINTTNCLMSVSINFYVCYSCI